MSSRGRTDTAAPAPGAAPFADFGPWTPVPNACLDRMPALSDTELRLLLAVLRQTLGWKDPHTGARKERDWLSQRRLMALTGRSNRAVSAALDALVGRGLVEARGTDGRARNTREGRRAAERLWLGPGPSLRPAGDGAAREGKPDNLTDAARDVFGVPAGGEAWEEKSLARSEEGSLARGAGSPADEERSLGRGVRATPGAERSVTKGHSTKETQYKTLRTEAVQKTDGGGEGQLRRPTPPARDVLAPFSPATEALMARFARYERQSTAKHWHWDKVQKKWTKTGGYSEQQEVRRATDGQEPSRPGATD